MRQDEFLQFALDNKVLRFGEFTLKSGRISPYFFNAGLFNTGEAVMRLGEFYAEVIADTAIEFEVLFGPAYKGVPLAAVTSACLYKNHNINAGFAFDRKEIKDHGEGGKVVGVPLAGRVLIIDDVITAGTSVREAVELIRAYGARLAGVVISLDRQEKGTGHKSAIEEIQDTYKVPVFNLANLDNLVEFVSAQPGLYQHKDKIQEYRRNYGT